MEEFIIQMYNEITKLKTKEEVKNFIENELSENKEIIEKIEEIFEDELIDIEEAIESKQEKEEWIEIKKEIELKIKILKKYLDPEKKEGTELELDSKIDIISERPIKIIWAKTDNGTAYCYEDLKKEKHEIRKERYYKYWRLLKRLIDEKKYKFTKNEILKSYKDMYKIRPLSPSAQERLYAYKIEDVIFIIGAYNKKATGTDEWEKWLKVREKAVKQEYEKLKELLKNQDEKEKILEKEQKTFEIIENLIKPKKKSKSQKTTPLKNEIITEDKIQSQEEIKEQTLIEENQDKIENIELIIIKKSILNNIKNMNKNEIYYVLEYVKSLIKELELPKLNKEIISKLNVDSQEKLELVTTYLIIYEQLKTMNIKELIEIQKVTETIIKYKKQERRKK